MLRNTIFAVVFVILASTGHAQKEAVVDSQSGSDLRSAFRKHAVVGPLRTITTPTLMEVRTQDGHLLTVERPHIIVWDREADRAIPADLILHSDSIVQTPFAVSDDAGRDVSARLRIPGGFVQYDRAPDEAPTPTAFVVRFEEPTAVDGIDFYIAQNTVAPESITIEAVAPDGTKTLLSDAFKPHVRSLYGRVNMPHTTLQEIRVIFAHRQPLRLTGLRPREYVEQKRENVIRFLAQPSRTYDIYSNADRTVDISFPADIVPDLFKRQNVLTYTAKFALNSLYVPADSDRDGVPDAQDNCVDIANTNQEDVDGNGVGDVCDDFDRDGIINSDDNCPSQPNRMQQDVDVDGIGDACDERESRFFQLLPWLPGALIVIATGIIGTLFLRTLRMHGAKREGKKDDA